MDIEERTKLLDAFAQSALNALITKMPFYDTKGEFGKQVSAEELLEIKKGITAAAYEYASYMLISRQGAIDWVKENKEFFDGAQTTAE